MLDTGRAQYIAGRRKSEPTMPLFLQVAHVWDGEAWQRTEELRGPSSREDAYLVAGSSRWRICQYRITHCVKMKSVRLSLEVKGQLLSIYKSVSRNHA